MENIAHNRSHIPELHNHIPTLSDLTWKVARSIIDDVMHDNIVGAWYLTFPILEQALRRKDECIWRTILDYFPDINRSNTGFYLIPWARVLGIPKWWSPIHWAARHGCVTGVQYLLDRGASIDTVDSGHCTPLYYAVLHNHFEAAKMLICRGANMHHVSNRNMSVLQLAVMNDQLDTVKYMLLSGLHVEDVLEHKIAAIFKSKEIAEADIPDKNDRKSAARVRKLMKGFLHNAGVDFSSFDDPSIKIPKLQELCCDTVRRLIVSGKDGNLYVKVHRLETTCHVKNMLRDVYVSSSSEEDNEDDVEEIVQDVACIA